MDEMEKDGTVPAQQEPEQVEQPAAEAALLTQEPEQESLVVEMGDEELRAIVEAVVYITEEPLTAEQIATALQQKKERVEAALAVLIAECEKPERGLVIKIVAGGFKMGTKAEHHDRIRQFVKNLKPPLKLSRVPSLSLPIWWHTEHVTPSSAA